MSGGAKRFPRFAIWGVFFALLCLLFRSAPADEAKAKPEAAVSSRQQIEADWLRQELVRDATKSGAYYGNVKREEDAAGGCDGIKDGKWGFHTNFEDNPWWQVDLQKPTPLDRLLIFNRCDIPQRASRLIVLLSDDGKQFQPVYRHNGKVFLGYTDNKPLAVELKGAVARYVRIQLPGKNYLHFDEVEVYSVGENRNVALKKPATQSSVSMWSVTHKPEVVEPQKYSTDTVIQRGLQLAEALRRMGGNVDAEVKTLQEVAGRLAGASEDLKKALYFQAHWAVRKMAKERIRCSTSTRSCLSRARRAICPTCRTSSTAGSRAPAAAFTCWRDSTATPRACAA